VALHLGSDCRSSDAAQQSPAVLRCAILSIGSTGGIRRETPRFHHFVQQPARIPRLGVLLFSTPTADPQMETARRALRDLGYVEGCNLALEYRYAEGRPERLPDLAADLVRIV
jgi:hypothetical protein